MALVIGIDEAGLGPNLGPFVVATSVWNVPGNPSDVDLWSLFSEVVTNTNSRDDSRIHIADSKKVFRPGKGIKSLERGVHSALALADIPVASFRSLCTELAKPLRVSPPTERIRPTKSLRRTLFDKDDQTLDVNELEIELSANSTAATPWYDSHELELPQEYDATSDDISSRWNSVCQQTGATLVCIRATVVEPVEFNRLVRQYDNKSTVTSSTALGILKNVWNPSVDDEALVIVDKQGGRDRYQSLLERTFPNTDVVVLEEGAMMSRYRVDHGEIRFQPQAEEHLPVALASMTAKYLRELAMNQFNHYWCQQLPGLKPTQGYPVDAKRFKAEIESLQKSLLIPDDHIWRER